MNFKEEEEILESSIKYRNDFLLLSNRYRYYHYHITMEKKRREGVIYFSQTS